jgi:dTDP-glucose 4,6-dehydratase
MSANSGNASTSLPVPGRLLITGGAGFIGSAFVRHMLAGHDTVSILTLDSLTYAGNLATLSAVDGNHRHRFMRGDICDKQMVSAAFATAEDVFGEPVDAVVHFAAETHVDRSIEAPAEFLWTNVLGTEIMLRVARERGVSRFLHISTDEVYGSLGPDDPPFTEESPFRPNSPYAASKAGADHMARAYRETYGMPVSILRCSNNYGPYQFPEKLIPLMIANALENKPLPVYGDGSNVRDWIFVEDFCRGIETVLFSDTLGEVYNLGGRCELANIHVVETLLDVLGKPKTLITFVKDRLGHDRRYAVDTTKIGRELGWKPSVTFEEGLARTIRWYLDNAEWVTTVKS